MHICMHCAADGLAGVWHGWPSLHVTHPDVAVRTFARRSNMLCAANVRTLLLGALRMLVIYSS